MLTPAKWLREEVAGLDTSRKALRAFGWVVGGVLLVIAAFVFYQNDGEATAAVIALAAGAAILLAGGAFRPAALRPLYIVWMTLALALGFVMTRVLLTITFVVMITPIGLLMRAFGKDPMQRKIDPALPTYWIPKEPSGDDRERLTRYF